jgi:hypothetical protein
MSTQIQTDHFTKALYALLDETFDNVQGYFLDKGTSMFESLATISAVVHTAYHLAEIRQALCMLKS